MNISTEIDFLSITDQLSPYRGWAMGGRGLGWAVHGGGWGAEGGVKHQFGLKEQCCVFSK